MMKFISPFILIAVVSPYLYSIENPYTLFERGNIFYKNGQYEHAAKIYQQIIDSGYISAEVYYNLGNSYYRLERLAQAILAFERAARLKPNDPDIQHNVKLCYLKTIDRIEPLPELFLIQWLRAFASLVSQSTAELLFLISWLILFTSMTIGYLVRQTVILRTARVLFFISVCCIAISALLIGVHELLDTSANEAIITAHTVTAKSSPDPKSIDAFVIHEGLKVKITDSVGSWIKITLPDGKIGWIEATQCEKI
ncbi:MAG: tetratricopeptide repeat protein [Bacteroidetes bacterium]|nr:tetratricopeptide repeat protein [Bacteroidota bacterium]